MKTKFLTLIAIMIFGLGFAQEPVKTVTTTQAVLSDENAQILKEKEQELLKNNARKRKKL